jgi:hypothetical protein
MTGPAMRLGAAVAIALSLASCGGERAEDRHWQPSPQASNGLVGAQVLTCERGGDRINARVRLENLSDVPIELKNLGDTLTGFRARVDGRDFSADARRRDEPTAASRIAEIPARTQVELDLRWTLDPAPRRRDYDCAIIVGNLWQADQRLPDISVALPRAQARDRDRDQELDDDGPEDKPAKRDGKEKAPVTF